MHLNSVGVRYVNSTVEVKAGSDISCTSSNALDVIKSIPADKEILFVPDRNLGSYVGKASGRKITCWDGYCPTHQWGFSSRDVSNMRAKYPSHKLLVHPESDPEIVDAADYVMSTGAMVRYAEEHDEMIIATETRLTNYLTYVYPHKSIHRLSPKAVSRNMKLTRVEDLYYALLNEEHHVQVEAKIAQAARKSIERMLAI